MSNMTPKKAFTAIVFGINRNFFRILNLLGNSMYELPNNGL